MYKYEVGQVIDNFKNHTEGTKFYLSDDGATINKGIAKFM